MKYDSITFYRAIPVMLLIGLLPLPAMAQLPEQIFTQEDYFRMILQNHPVVRQAGLLNAEADAYLRKARGGFDPNLDGNVEQKSFDGKEYFTLGNMGFKIPTWYGVEVKGGFLWESGIFVDPSNGLPAAGQAELGLSINLLQGLFIDKRRAVLQQARIMQEQNEAERLAIVNEILLEANEVYWEWVFAQQVVSIYEEALRLAEVRYDGVVVSVQQGYYSAVDTLESGIQVQTRQAALQEALVNLENAALELSNFLWTADGIPLEIGDGLRAPRIDELESTALRNEYLADMREIIRNQHPALMAYRLELDQLEVEQRLKREMLKPRLQVSYNFLGNGFDFNAYQNGEDSGFRNLLLQNYKWGVDFSFPLFLRKERGDLELNALKIQKTDFKRQQKQLELQNKLNTYYNLSNNLHTQIGLYEKMVRDYRNLLEAENERFRLGISSLFLINSREQKLIEAQKKLASLKTKYQKNLVAIRGVAGLLAN